MLTYEPQIERYIYSRLAGQRDELSLKIEAFLRQLPPLCGDERKRHLASNLLNKTHVLLREIWDEGVSLQVGVSSLRYVFEALVHAELLSREDDYFEKIYYSVQVVRQERAEAFLRKIKADLRVLERYEAKELEIRQAYRDSASEEGLARLDVEEERIYRELERELSISLDATEFNSIHVQKSLLADKLIPAYETDNPGLKTEFTDLAQQLVASIPFNRKFDLRGQKTKVEKVLRDQRSWRKKAEDAGLGEEYEFLYKYSSAILHCTSYSIFTSAELERAELLMFRSLANKYLFRLLDCLRAFCTPHVRHIELE
jgi:hypothetical protein